MFTRLAREFGDRTVWMKAVEPDPWRYYEAHFGQAAVFEFPAVCDAEAYTSQMHEWPAVSIADAIAYRADVVAWAGLSGRWAAWGERELNLCVLHVCEPQRLAKELALMPDDFVPLLAIGEALSSVVSNELGKKDLDAFASCMEESYPVSA